MSSWGGNILRRMETMYMYSKKQHTKMENIYPDIHVSSHFVYSIYNKVYQEEKRIVLSIKEKPQNNTIFYVPQ